MFQQDGESSSRSLLENGFGILCLMAFAFAPSYEGTGRSLSLKLIQQLRQQSAQSQVSTTAENKMTTTARLAAGTLELWLGPSPRDIMGGTKPSYSQIQSSRAEMAFLHRVASQ